MNPNAGKPLKYLLAHMNDGCCTPWPFTKQKGYGWVWDKNRRIGAAHVIVCTMVNGPKPSPDHHARHLCGKGHLGCFNAACLKWGTAKDNAADAIRHGTFVKGERSGQAKLTDEAVIEIRAQRGRVAQPILAKRFGVSQSLVSLVQLGKAWAHV
jgi:hypothetical protein